MSMESAALESPLDLAVAVVTEPGPGVLRAQSVRTSERARLAAGFGVVAAVLLALAWRAGRQSVLDALYPWGFMAPVFAVVAVVVGFASTTKTFDSRARVATVTAGLGPLRYERRIELPAHEEIQVLHQREEPSRASGKAIGTATHQHIVDVAGRPELGFTASDREAARSVARRLSDLLGYPLKDLAEDDGIERIPPR